MPGMSTFEPRRILFDSSTWIVWRWGERSPAENRRILSGILRLCGVGLQLPGWTRRYDMSSGARFIGAETARGKQGIGGSSSPVGASG
jgi:hypothetical protein